MEMLFKRSARGDGSPVPCMPLDQDGQWVKPDCVRYFTLEQAVEVFGMSQDELREIYLEVFGGLMAPPPAEGQVAPLAFDPARVAVGRQHLVRVHRFPHLTEDEFQTVADLCTLRKLDLWRHVWAEVRPNPQTGKRELKVMTTIDAFVLIADRSGRYDGTTEPEYLSADGRWIGPVWTEPGYPVAARAGVRRKDFSTPQMEVARWDRYVQYINTERGLEVADHWVRAGAEMLSKCALALAFRKGFSEELGGLFLKDELDQSTNPAAQVAAPSGPVPAFAPTRFRPADSAIIDSHPPDEVEINDDTPATMAEFERALEGFGFGTDAARRAVIARLRLNIPLPPTSKSFWAAALRRLRQRPDLYGASGNAA